MDEQDDTVRSTVRALFADGEPRGIDEVVAATGVEESAATDALADLVSVGELGEKTVGDGDSAVTVWYPTTLPGVDEADGSERKDGDESNGATTFELRGIEPTRRSGGTSEGSSRATHVTEEIEEAVADLDVPGASEMMRSWRRDALRAAGEYLAEQGTLGSMAILEEVYPGHRAGYEDRDQWWAFVGDYLPKLPGVSREGDVWEYDR